MSLVGFSLSPGFKSHTEYQTYSWDRVYLHTHIVFCDMSCFCNLNPGSAPMFVVGPTPHLPLALQPSLPSPCIIGMCWLCVLQVRAASTVTSWSNQTPTALPNVPLPLQVGSAPEHKVQRSSVVTYHTPLQTRSHDSTVLMWLWSKPASFSLAPVWFGVFRCNAITMLQGFVCVENHFWFDLNCVWSKVMMRAVLRPQHTCLICIPLSSFCLTV